METNYNQISFCSLTAGFLALGAFKSFSAYLSTFKTKNKKPVKNPKQIELWLNSYTSFNSVVSYVGFVTETYYYGSRLLINLVAISIGYIVSVIILQPFFYDMGVKTPYEYLQKRYSNRLICRCLGAFVAILFHISFSTLFLWANATILSSVFPELSLSTSIIVIGAVSLVFAISGGVIQSMYINILQFIIYIFGVLAALIIATLIPGNAIGYYWNLAKENNRLNFIVTAGDLNTRYTIWNQIFSLPIPWCAFHGLLIPNVNRYKAINSKSKSSIFLISNLPIMFIVNSIAVLIGVFCYIIFYNCDPYLSEKYQNKNQIASYFLIKVLDEKLPSVAGLCLSSLIVVGIMQHSFGISLVGQIFINDIINPIAVEKFKRSLSQFALNIIKTSLVFIIGVLSIFYSMSFQYVRNSILSLFFLFNNSINSPLFALFILSMFNPYANHVGALSSLFITLGINFWLGISAVTINSKSQEFIQNTNGCNSSSSLRSLVNNTSININGTLYYLYTISSIWYCLFSLLFITIFGSLISLLYALLVKRRIDLDNNNNELKQYLFNFQKNFVFKICKSKKKNDTNINSENEIMDTQL